MECGSTVASTLELVVILQKLKFPKDVDILLFLVFIRNIIAVFKQGSGV